MSRTRRASSRIWAGWCRQSGSFLCHGDRSLGVIPQREAWYAEERRLFMDAARVRQDEPGSAQQRDEIEVAEWLGEGDARRWAFLRGRRRATPPRRFPQTATNAGMDGEDDRKAPSKLVESVEQGDESRRIIDIGGT